MPDFSRHPAGGETITAARLAEHMEDFLGLANRWVSGFGITTSGASLNVTIDTGVTIVAGFRVGRSTDSSVVKTLNPSTTSYIFIQEDGDLFVDETGSGPGGGVEALLLWTVTTDGSGVPGAPTDNRPNVSLVQFASDFGADTFIAQTDGVVSAPAYGFDSDPDTGMYLIGAGILGFAVGGNERARLTATTLTTNHIIASDGVQTLTKAGVPSDGDFVVTPADGAIAVDTLNSLLYFRSGASWLAASATAGNGLTGGGASPIDVGAGDGITVNTNDVAVNLATNPGLEFATAALRVLVDPAGALERVAAGIDVKDLGIDTARIADDNVTNAKLANMATQSIKGRTTAGTGDPEDLTAAQVRTILNVENGATADQTAADIRGLGFFDTSNDGASSGLDADLLDGQHASAFLGASAKAADSNLLDGIDSTGFVRPASGSSKKMAGGIKTGTTDASGNITVATGLSTIDGYGTSCVVDTGNFYIVAHVSKSGGSFTVQVGAGGSPLGNTSVTFAWTAYGS